MKWNFVKIYEVDMLKIIIIIIVYTLNKFHYSYHNIIVNDGNFYNFKMKNQFYLFLIIHFVNVETDPRTWWPTLS